MRKSQCLVVLAALVGLVGCEVTDTTQPPRDERFFEGTWVNEAYAFAFSEMPFERGAIDIVASEGGQMRTFRLVVCRGGTTICAGSLNGRAGQLERGPEYWVVTGLYGNRAFYLSPGGDGAIYYGNERAAALAWNNVG